MADRRSEAFVDRVMDGIDDSELRDASVAQTTGTNPSAGRDLGVEAGKACEHLAPG